MKKLYSLMLLACYPLCSMDQPAAKQRLERKGDGWILNLKPSDQNAQSLGLTNVPKDQLAIKKSLCGSNGWVAGKKFPVVLSDGFIDAWSFSSSGKSVITQQQIWDSDTGNKVFEHDPKMYWDGATFNKDLTKLWLVAKNGASCCVNVPNGTVVYNHDEIPGVEVWNHDVRVSDDNKLLLKQHSRQSILLDAYTGNFKKILWKQHGKDRDAIYATIIKSCINVFHNGCLKEYNDDADVQYHEVVPKGAYATLYSASENSVIYFYSEEDCYDNECYLTGGGGDPEDVSKVGICNIDTKEKKIFDLVSHDDGGYYDRYEFKLIDNGSKLQMFLVARGGHNWLDIYDLKTGKDIFSIKFESYLFSSSFNAKKNLLVLALADKVHLWNLANQDCEVATLGYGDMSGKVRNASVDISEDGDKIIVAKNEATIWTLAQDNPGICSFL